MAFTEKKRSFIGYFPAVLTGFLLAMSFPGTKCSPLAWVAIVPLMVSVKSMGRKQAFYAGLTAGMAFFISLIYWIVPTLNTYGGLPFFLAVPVFVLLAFYLGLYTGIFALVFNLLKTDSMLMPLNAAAVWVGLEYLRSFLFTGFPWGTLGYSQYMNIHLIQIADITGVYGISFLIVMASAVFSMVWISIAKSGQYTERPGMKTNISCCIYLVIISISVSLYGMARLDTIHRKEKKSDKTTVSVVQGNINQAVKWDRAFKESTMKRYCDLSEKASHNRPDLIVWPETALPFYYPLDRNASAMVNRCIRKAGTNFLVGSPAFQRGKNRLKFFNRAYMINKSAAVTGAYDKVHLVPFGEYVPFGKYLSFLGKLTAQAGDFSAGGNNFMPLKFKNHRAGVLICFEIIFPSLARNFVNNGADLLVNITNDAWFGRTSAPLQHFSMTVFRAVENRRSLARAANTGISGFIAPTGRILMTSRLYQEMFLTEKLPCLKIKSFYTSFGDFFAFICLVAIPIIFMVNKKYNLKAL